MAENTREAADEPVTPEQEAALRAVVRDMANVLDEVREVADRASSPSPLDERLPTQMVLGVLAGMTSALAEVHRMAADAASTLLQQLGRDVGSHTLRVQLERDASMADKLAAIHRLRVQLERDVSTADGLAEPTADRPQAMFASELSVEEVERMLAAPVAAECEELDHLVPDGWLDEHEKFLASRR